MRRTTLRPDESGSLSEVLEQVHHPKHLITLRSSYPRAGSNLKSSGQLLDGTVFWPFLHLCLRTGKSLFLLFLRQNSSGKVLFYPSCLSYLEGDL